MLLRSIGLHRSLRLVTFLALLFGGLAIPASAALYVSNYISDTIKLFDPFPKVIASFPLLEPRGLVFDEDGNLYAASATNSTIERFAPDGTRSLFASVGLNGPRGLAFDTNGDLFVTNGDCRTLSWDW